MVLMVVAIFSVSAFSSLIQFDFAFHSIEWWGFIALTATRMAMQFLAKYYGAESRVQKGRVSDAVINAQNEFMEQSKKVDPAPFCDWITEENHRLKVNTYRKKIERKIEALRLKHSKAKYKAQKKTESKRLVARIEKLEHRIEELLGRITDKYIAENIAHIKVKYQPLRAADFLSLAETAGYRVLYSFDSHRSNMVAVAKGLPMTAAVSLFLASAGLSWSFGTFSIVSMLLDLIAVFSNLFTGLYVIGERAIMSLIDTYVNRKTVVCRYLAQQGNHN